jgi:hypothetical protein
VLIVPTRPASGALGYPNSALEQRLHACGARAAAKRLAKLTA